MSAFASYGSSGSLGEDGFSSPCNSSDSWELPIPEASNPAFNRRRSISTIFAIVALVSITCLAALQIYPSSMNYLSNLILSKPSSAVNGASGIFSDSNGGLSPTTPTSVSVVSPTSVSVTAPTSVTVTTPTSVAVTTPTSVAVTTPTSVTVTTPTSVAITTPTSVSVTTPTSVTSPTSVSVTTPTSVTVTTPTTITTPLSVVTPTSVSVTTPTSVALPTTTITTPTTVVTPTSTIITVVIPTQAPTAIPLATPTAVPVVAPTSITVPTTISIPTIVTTPTSITTPTSVVMPVSVTTPTVTLISLPTSSPTAAIVPTASPIAVMIPTFPTSDVAVDETDVDEDETDTTNTNEMQFTLSRNGYDPLIYFTPVDISIFKYKILEDYVAVIEPYGDMTLNVFGSSDDKYYTYTVCSEAVSTECYSGVKYSSQSSTLTSTTVNIPCTVFADYIVTVEELYLTNNAVVRSSSGLAKCMYVRREIRTLSDDDLSNTMDAMFAMWDTSELEGQKVYGPNFHSSTYLLEFHFFNAAWQDADHIHEGNGFLPQHIKMTNIFEASIQTVDPSVSLPFWDFTIESTQNISVMLSPIFTENMFGSMPRSVDQYWGWTYRNDSLAAAAIQDGRWKGIKADKNDRYSDLKYGYGYLRAPWNLNPSPYLSRFTSTNKHLPSCTSHYTLLEYDDLADFLFESPYAAHAATHGTIGGVYGCDIFDTMMDQGYLVDDDGQINLCKNWIFYMKEFYRLDYLMPYSNCTYTDTVPPQELSCGYTCNEELTEDFVFELKNILNSDNDCIPYDLQDAGWYAWRDFICTGDGYKLFGGDHLEAASPADPSFWPIHPTLERLLQAKYMAGGFDDDSWPEDAVNDYVCDKPTCYDATYGNGYWDSCCYGHYGDDQLLDASTGDRDAGYGMTNREVHAATDPTSENYTMPYIYSDFDWAHCSLVGLDFTSLLTEMSVKADDTTTPVPTMKPTASDFDDNTGVIHKASEANPMVGGTFSSIPKAAMVKSSRKKRDRRSRKMRS